MRFAICTTAGLTLSWWLRLQDEGHEVYVYYYPDKGSPIAQRFVGRGLVPLATSREAWIKWGSASSSTIWFFDFTGAGELAELLRRAGRLVVGSGALADRLEKDRVFGEKFAEKAGILMPPTKEFSTISAAQAFLKTNPKQEHGDGGWAWKSNVFLESAATKVGSDSAEVIEYLEYAKRRWRDNISCILQERIKGVALSTAQWWNGRTFVGPVQATIEEKKFLNGDLGPSTGCSLNLVWFYKTYPQVARALQWEKVGELLRKADAPPGLYDVNAIVNKSGAWFLEWTPRLGIDSELTSQRGICNLGAFLRNLAAGRSVDHLFDIDQTYMGVHLSVPPYPNEGAGIEDLKIPANTPVRGEDGLWDKFFVAGGLGKGELGLEVTDPCGFVGVAVTAGTNLDEAFDECYDYLKEKLKVNDLQYRTDCADVVREDLEDMMDDGGWESTPVLEY